MEIVDIRDAKKQLGKLIEGAVRGEPFIIAVDGRPQVRVMPLQQAVGSRRLGFMHGEIAVPDDFDCMGREEIGQMFGLMDRV